MFVCGFVFLNNYFVFARTAFTSDAVTVDALLPKLFLTYVNTSAICWSFKIFKAGIGFVKVSPSISIFSFRPFKIIFIKRSLFPKT